MKVQFVFHVGLHKEEERKRMKEIKRVEESEICEKICFIFENRIKIV